MKTNCSRCGGQDGACYVCKPATPDDLYMTAEDAETEKADNQRTEELAHDETY